MFRRMRFAVHFLLLVAKLGEHEVIEGESERTVGATEAPFMQNYPDIQLFRKVHLLVAPVAFIRHTVELHGVHVIRVTFVIRRRRTVALCRAIVPGTIHRRMLLCFFLNSKNCVRSRRYVVSLSVGMFVSTKRTQILYKYPHGILPAFRSVRCVQNCDRRHRPIGVFYNPPICTLQNVCIFKNKSYQTIVPNYRNG